MVDFNLLAGLRASVPPETYARLGSAIDETPESTMRASNTALPALIGGMAALSQTERGATRLLALARERERSDPGASSDDALRADGQGLLDTIFGSKLGVVVECLSRSTGGSY